MRPRTEPINEPSNYGTVRPLRHLGVRRAAVAFADRPCSSDQGVLDISCSCMLFLSVRSMKGLGHFFIQQKTSAAIRQRRRCGMDSFVRPLVTLPFASTG